MNTVTAFFQKLGPDILLHTYEHVVLTLVSLGIALCIAFPLGTYLTRCRWPKLVAVILGIAGVIQTVPSLALIAFIVLIFAFAALPTIGPEPAVVALVLYALLPILRNTYTGIRQVDPSIIEVAQGMGMTSRQILFRVELPLSLPVIMAGVRIATVWTIGVACLCTFVGGGGLGDLIMIGLSTIQPDYMIAGTAPAALLAVVFDWVLARLETDFTPKKLVLLIGAIIMGATMPLMLWPPYEARETPLRAAFDAEFHARPDGYKGLCAHYGFEFPEEPSQMDPGLMYKAVADGAVDVIDAFATDGRIAAYDLLVLEDDKGFFPPYFAAPLIRQETLRRHPEIGRILDRIAGDLSDEVMRGLNYEVDEKGRKAAEVAREFLIARGLVREGARPGDGSAGRITIGGKQFTEQRVLGELMAILIESNSDIKVVRRLNLGGTMICFNALKAGDLDLYAEYTGTGLVNILKKNGISDPEEAFDVVREAFAEEYGLIWLEPFGLNNTYTLTMRKQQADKLGIRTISDLARLLGGKGKAVDRPPQASIGLGQVFLQWFRGSW